MKSFWKWFDRINDVMAGLAGVILVFICAAVCYSIGMRFLFKKTTIWIMQTTEYALLWILFLSTTWLLKGGRPHYDGYYPFSSQRGNQALS